jgi:hypothetical protein
MDKSEIINAIIRTTEENGGIPLGKERFYKLTGIKESDWIGKHWVKWSDVIIEAGYSPNTMNASYSDEYLLESYASLIRELNHIPTSPEIKIKARNCPSFPSHNTFGKYGTKDQVLNRVLSFCKIRNGYSDVITIIEKNQIKRDSQIENESKNQLGYVYLLEFGDDYKIGSSNNIERRFKEIKVQMPTDGKIIHTINTEDPSGIEAYWHNYFKDKRQNGEWFKLSKTDISYFKKRKYM